MSELAAVAEVGVGVVLEMMTSILDDRIESGDLLGLMHNESRSWAARTRDGMLSEREARAALDAARRRKGGAPLEYAAQRAAFRHLHLHVDERVLIPRPETELLVDIVLGMVQGGIVVDVGTGSGAIALSLVMEGSYDKVIATDISLDAVDVARENARALNLSVDVRHGALLAPVSEGFLRAVVSNPPYISFAEAAALPDAVRNWEPSVALFSERDGLKTTEELISQAAVKLAPGGVIALEVDAARAGRVAALCTANDAFQDVTVKRDLTDRDRFVVARRKL